MIYKRKHQHVFKLLSILKDFFLAEKDMECTDADNGSNYAAERHRSYHGNH